jgi:peptidyl-prolyl cis-trans isomerase SurA
MKPTSFLPISTIFLLSAFCQAQDLNNKILMSVGGKEIETGEFFRMYKKSIEPGKSPDIDSYLQQFIVFKLKVSDAVAQGYDTTIAFKTELGGYRKQLAQNYLTDTQVKDKILQIAYQRYLTEVNAWHILIALAPDASAVDTLNAWKKASDIRERIIRGESFESVARSSSDDPSVKNNGGNLGYFTVFQMIMPFEEAAFSLKTGTISPPVRTPYGYHIIKVTDKRPSRGRIKVAHIMKSAPPGTSEGDEKQALDEINGIYNKLIKGASFREMAINYSDHKESAVKGGELEWFGAGEIISDFSEAAFSLRDTGSYTKPFRTAYGWHIIKLLDRKPPGSFEETRSFLESKLNQSNLNSISKKSFVDKLKKEYKFTINQDACNWFVRNTDSLIIKGLKKYDHSIIPATDLYRFANQNFTTTDFANYIDNRGSMIMTKDSVAFINQSLETQVSDQLITYENSILEKKYPEFRYLMNEFHDGILLFEISGKRVWNRVSNDSVGLHRYYEESKNNYLSKPGIAAKIYTLRSPGKEKLLTAAYQKYSGRNNGDELMIKKFNRRIDTLLTIDKRIWLKDDDPDIDKLVWVTGMQLIRKGSFPSIILISDIIKPVPLSFDEVKGEMMTGYQDYLEGEWVRQLKEKFSVKIDNLLLEEAKKKLKDE